MDFVQYFTNKAKLSTNGPEKQRFLKLAKLHKMKQEDAVEACTDSCPIDDVPAPKRGRKPKVQKEEGAD